MKFLNNLDLQQNQVLNVIIHQLAAPPAAPKEGQIYFNTVNKGLWYWDNTKWVNIGDITAILTPDGSGLSGGLSEGAASLQINVDNATLEISANTVRIKDAGVTTNKIADGNVTTVKILDKNITFQKLQDIATMTVIGRVDGGTGTPQQIAILNEPEFTSNSASSLATQASIKAYVDSRVASIGTLIGGFDPNNGVFPGNASTKKGDYWYATANGSVGGINFNIGDVIIANQAVPGQTPANYTVLETNRDQATTTVLGVVRLATTAEAQAGTDTTAVITAATLKAVLDNRTGGYSALVGDGSATVYNITHNLNAIDVVIQLFDAGTGELVFTNILVSGTNTVSLSFSVAPSASQYRVVIKK